MTATWGEEPLAHPIWDEPTSGAFMYDQHSTVHVQTLTGRLIDEISEALLRPRRPHERSVAVCAIVEEIYENIRWLHGSTQSAEVESLAQLLMAARAHSAQMDEQYGVRPRLDIGQHRVGSSASGQT